MGHLIKGEWKNDEVATSNDKGEFDREESSFRDTISKHHEYFIPEKNRYHLYVSYACPWAHRTLITRKLKQLDNIIEVSVVHPEMLENSWTFKKFFEGTTGDLLHKKKYLYEIYQKHDSQVTTKVTVPVLWDTKTQKIVNNESSEIIRIFDSAFNDFIPPSDSLYPSELKDEIDHMNHLTYEPINNGVYKAGFAKNQDAYDDAVSTLFSALDDIETHLKGKNYLVANRLTEADIRLITTLLRFDPVYHIHFKCSYKKIEDYKELSRYTKYLYHKYEAISSTTHLDHIRQHYYYSHEFLNPNRIVPVKSYEYFFQKL